MSRDEAPAARFLVFAPIGRDARASADLLRRAGVPADCCANLKSLVAALDNDMGGVLFAEEGLFGQDLRPLAAKVAAQPAWSDLPFVMLTSHQEQPAVAAWRQNVTTSLRNVSLLERPVHAMTLTSAVQAALRARLRQFEVRDLLNALEAAAQDLEGLVEERTSALADANTELRAQMEERARVEATLRQAQRMEAIGQLTGGIAHDFNNLLMVISGGLDMLDRHHDPSRRARLMEGMKQAADRGAGLTRQLLAFSRRQELKPEPINIARQIGRMRELLDRSLRGDVHVALELMSGLWPTEVDPAELELVVLNLAVNARDAMQGGGTITIRVENAPNFVSSDIQGDFVCLAVIDTGVGMPPHVKEHAFEPFFTTKDVGRGSGLGLAQVYGFAKQSGGTVRIDTEIGRGTTIRLFLPRSHKNPKVEEPLRIEIREKAVPAHPAGCVLLVEDDEEVAALVAEMLDQLGYDVTRAASADAALGALANGRKVDLIFSDIMMPGELNGVGLAREVRKRRSDLPILLTSGFAEAARLEAEAEGVRILAKPYRLSELAAALQELRLSGSA